MIDWLSSLDRTFFLILNGWHAKWLDSVMVILSGQLIWLPFIFILIFLANKKLERKAFYLFILFMLLVIIASDVTSSYLLKNIIQRLRPCKVAELKPFIYSFKQKCGGRFGFVSSHAANSFGLLVYSFVVLQIKDLKYHLMWILPLLVSYSRIYLGVHYPGDILGGLIIGGLWGWSMARFFQISQSTELDG